METINKNIIANQLFVKIRESYGRKLIYPNCPMSFSFADLLGTKTLPDHAIQTIKGMGFRFTVESEEL